MRKVFDMRRGRGDLSYVKPVNLTFDTNTNFGGEEVAAVRAGMRAGDQKESSFG